MASEPGACIPYFVTLASNSALVLQEEQLVSFSTAPPLVVIHDITIYGMRKREIGAGGITEIL